MKFLLIVKNKNKSITIEPYSLLSALLLIEYAKSNFDVICYLTLKK